MSESDKIVSFTPSDSSIESQGAQETPEPTAITTPLSQIETAPPLMSIEHSDKSNQYVETRVCESVPNSVEL